MKIGKVVGSVVATRKDERLTGFKLMIVQELKPVPGGSQELVPSKGSSEFCVAVDLVGAGCGELVLVTSGSSARNAASGTPDSPIDMAIVGIIDETSVDGRTVS